MDRAKIRRLLRFNASIKPLLTRNIVEQPGQSSPKSTTILVKPSLIAWLLSKSHPTFTATVVDFRPSQCAPKLTYVYSSDNTHITGVTVGATGNSCSKPIPVQFPGPATTSSGGVVNEQLGTDPLTKWSTLSGSAVTFTLTTPIAV